MTKHTTKTPDITGRRLPDGGVVGPLVSSPTGVGAIRAGWEDPSDKCWPWACIEVTDDEWYAWPISPARDWNAAQRATITGTCISIEDGDRKACAALAAYLDSNGYPDDRTVADSATVDWQARALSTESALDELRAEIWRTGQIAGRLRELAERRSVDAGAPDDERRQTPLEG